MIISCNPSKSNKSDSMKNFSVELLKPKNGQISRMNFEDSNSAEKSCKIQIALNGFIFENQKIETSISLDFIPLNFKNVYELENKTFQFPINPEPGYIDGSIYLFNVHNPFDVKKIEFGKITNSTIETSIYYDIAFEYENTGYENITNQKLIIPLSFEKLK